MSSNGQRVYTNLITLNPPTGVDGDPVSHYACGADPNGVITSAAVGDRAWQDDGTAWVCTDVGPPAVWEVWGSGGGAGSQQRIQFIARTGETDEANGVYPTFEDAHAAALLVTDCQKLIFVDGGGTPMEPAAGTYDMTDIALAGWPSPERASAFQPYQVLQTNDGVVFENFLLGVTDLQVYHTGSAPLITIDATGGVAVFDLGAGSWWLSDGTSEVISVTGGSVLFLFKELTVLGGDNNPVVDLAVGTTATALVGGSAASLQEDAFSGPVGSNLGLTLNNVVTYNLQTTFLGTLTLSGPAASTTLYVVGDPADWAGAPASMSVKSALDRMAALLYTLNGSAPIPV